MKKLNFANKFLQEEGILKINWSFTWIGRTYTNYLVSKVTNEQELDYYLETLKKEIMKFMTIKRGGN